MRDAIPELLLERSMSRRELARRIEVDSAHLSRVLDASGDRTPSADLAERAAVALGLPEDFFPEAREAAILRRMRADPAWRDRVYDRMDADGGRARGTVDAWAVEVVPPAGGDPILRRYATPRAARAAFARLHGARRLVRLQDDGRGWVEVEELEPPSRAG